MTSKEFKRKLDFYRGYLPAVKYFTADSAPAFIWRFNVIYPHCYKYCYSDTLDIDFDIENAQRIYIDRFYKQEYFIQINRFCIPFLKSCSEYQLAVIKQDSELRIYLSLLGFE